MVNPGFRIKPGLCISRIKDPKVNLPLLECTAEGMEKHAGYQQEN